MKILTTLSLALVVGFAGCNLGGSINGVKGSGIIKTEKRSVAPFDAVEVSCHGTIKAQAQGQESLEIRGDDNIVPLITTEVNNGVLYIRSSKEYNPREKLEIIISAPDLKKFDFSGAGSANLSNVKNDRMEITMNGAGSLTASGETKDAAITLSGAGSIDAKNLHAVDAKVNSTGVGNIEIYATGQLDAKTSGVGEINYYGNPKIVNRQAGGIGKINGK